MTLTCQKLFSMQDWQPFNQRMLMGDDGLEESQTEAPSENPVAPLGNPPPEENPVKDCVANASPAAEDPPANADSVVAPAAVVADSLPAPAEVAPDSGDWVHVNDLPPCSQVLVIEDSLPPPPAVDDALVRELEAAFEETGSSPPAPEPSLKRACGNEAQESFTNHQR